MMTLNHGFSGYVCARAAMPLIRRWTPIPEHAAALALLLGALLPDADSLMNAALPGSYFSGAWYGHRQASHSILGTLLIALLAALPQAGWLARRGLAWGRAYAGLVPLYWAGGLLHVLGDLFSPRMPMPLLWPWPGEYGALSHIGWFSPFLLWLFVAALVLEALLRRIATPPGNPASNFDDRVWALHAVTASIWLGYLFGSRFESAAQWSAYQRGLLPDSLVTPLEQGVRAAWYWLVR